MSITTSANSNIMHYTVRFRDDFDFGEPPIDGDLGFIVEESGGSPYNIYPLPKAEAKPIAVAHTSAFKYPNARFHVRILDVTLKNGTVRLPTKSEEKGELFPVSEQKQKQKQEQEQEQKQEQKDHSTDESTKEIKHYNVTFQYEGQTGGPISYVGFIVNGRYAPIYSIVRRSDNSMAPIAQAHASNFGSVDTGISVQVVSVDLQNGTTRPPTEAEKNGELFPAASEQKLEQENSSSEVSMEKLLKMNADLKETETLVKELLLLDSELEKLKQRKETLQAKIKMVKLRLRMKSQKKSDSTKPISTGAVLVTIMNAKSNSIHAMIADAEQKNEQKRKEEKVEKRRQKEVELRNEILTILGQKFCLQFSDGGCMVHKIIMDHRCSGWEMYRHQIQEISTVQGVLILDYLYTNKISFNKMCVSDILKLLKALAQIMKVDRGRPEILCNRHLKTLLTVEEYASTLMYSMENKLIETESVVRNLIHRDIKKFIVCDSSRKLEPEIILELLQDSFKKYRTLRLITPDSTYQSDLKLIITSNGMDGMDTTVNKFAGLLKAHHPTSI
jgi:hypothetical protein